MTRIALTFSFSPFRPFAWVVFWAVSARYFACCSKIQTIQSVMLNLRSLQEQQFFPFVTTIGPASGRNLAFWPASGRNFYWTGQRVSFRRLILLDLYYQVRFWFFLPCSPCKIAIEIPILVVFSELSRLHLLSGSQYQIRPHCWPKLSSCPALIWRRFLLLTDFSSRHRSLLPPQ